MFISSVLLCGVDHVPSSRWGHTLCMTAESEAVLIGGQGDKSMLCRDAVYQLDMCSYFHLLFSAVLRSECAFR